MTATTMTANTAAVGNSIVSLLQGMPTSLITMSQTQVTASGSPQTVTVTSTTGITNGTAVYVDLANPELVTPSNVTATTFDATFTKNHTGNWTVGTGTLLYTLARLGEVQDPTDVLIYGSVKFQQRKTARYTAGWKVNSEPVFLVESGVDQTDPVLAENTIMNIGDALTFLLVHRYALNSVPGVYVTLTDMDDKAAWKVFPSGRIYRVHMCYMKCIQQFTTILQP